jgi:hypothetical protein
MRGTCSFSTGIASLLPWQAGQSAWFQHRTLWPACQEITRPEGYKEVVMSVMSSMSIKISKNGREFLLTWEEFLKYLDSNKSRSSEKVEVVDVIRTQAA